MKVWRSRLHIYTEIFLKNFCKKYIDLECVKTMPSFLSWNNKGSTKDEFTLWWKCDYGGPISRFGPTVRYLSFQRLHRYLLALDYAAAGNIPSSSLLQCNEKITRNYTPRSSVAPTGPPRSVPGFSSGMARRTGSWGRSRRSLAAAWNLFEIPEFLIDRRVNGLPNFQEIFFLRAHCIS